MKTKTNIQAGPAYMGVYVNHNQSLRVKSNVKAGDTDLIASRVHYSSRYNNAF